MKRILLREHGRLVRWRASTPPPPSTLARVYLDAARYDRLARFESAQPEAALRWHSDHARAQQWVGVIQIPGLQLEILPKIDVTHDDLSTLTVASVRQNLLFMLRFCRRVPMRPRGAASLTVSRDMPLLDWLTARFAQRILDELGRGAPMGYQAHRENRRALRGRLCIRDHLRHNLVRHDRFFCEYRALTPNTPLNQVLKASCQMLLRDRVQTRTREAIERALALLASVEPPVDPLGCLERVQLDRRSERFRDLLPMCRLILEHAAPGAQRGDHLGYSILFDMNRVFEDFLSAFLDQRVLPQLRGYELITQRAQRRRFLMRSGRRGVLALEPDLLIKHPDGRHLVLDAKWKRLPPSSPGQRGGVARADLYQLFAYTQRYGCQRSVLLYPRVADAPPRRFDILDVAGEASGRELCIEFVDLSRDLGSPRALDALAQELKVVVQRGFDPEPTPPRSL